MHLTSTRVAVYAIFGIAVSVILLFHLMTTFPRTPNETGVSFPRRQNVTRDCTRSRWRTSPVDVVFVAKWAFRNMKVTRSMSRCLKSILAYARRPLRFHVLADPQSYMRLRRTLHSVREESKTMFQYALYNITSVQEKHKEVIKVMRKLFFTKDVGRYNDDMFFITEIFHKVFRLERAIFIDLDLQFQDDIAKLDDIFNCFESEHLIGIGHDLQPQYRVDFAKYRSKHPGSDVGLARPGRQGFNTGVMLMNLEAMRSSKLYNSLLNYTNLKVLCDKYSFQGSLGHQDFFTLVGMEHPELFFLLDCVWNRQLDTSWEHTVKKDVFDAYHRCPGKIRVFHANGGARLPDVRGLV